MSIKTLGKLLKRATQLIILAMAYIAGIILTIGLFLCVIIGVIPLLTVATIEKLIDSLANIGKRLEKLQKNIEDAIWRK